MNSPRRDLIGALRGTRKRLRAASGRPGSVGVDSRGADFVRGATGRKVERAASTGELLVKAPKSSPLSRKLGKHEGRIVGKVRIIDVKTSREMDERMMELERKVERLQKGGILQSALGCTLTFNPVGAFALSPTTPGTIATAAPASAPSLLAAFAQQMYPQPKEFNVGGPLPRNRFTVKPTDPATLSSSRQQTILKRFGLEPKDEDWAIRRGLRPPFSFPLPARRRCRLATGHVTPFPLIHAL